MKSKRIVAFLLLLPVVACVPAVSTIGVGGPESIPQAVYTMYLYSAPDTPQLKTAFLKNQDAGVEVVPFSVQITTASGTVKDALDYVGERPGFRRVAIQRVELKGNTIGYLLLPERHSFARRYIEVNFYERNGKILLVPSEQGVAD